MKKILFAAVSALTIGAAIAADSTQFGVLKVPSGATQTIVAVPWLESGTGNDPDKDAVKVADLVLTAGLHENDELRLYDNGSWTKAWKLNAAGKWEGAQVAVTGGTTASGDDSTRIARGKAIMLIRSNPASCFYIMGKPAALSAEEKTLDLPNPGSGGPAYALIAPPKAAAATVGSLSWNGLVPYADALIVSTNTVLTWTAGGWKNKSGSASSVEIPLGQGVWFMSVGTPKSGTKSVSWEQ